MVVYLLLIGLSVILCAISTTVSGLLVHHIEQKAHTMELARLMYTHEQAMLFLRAGSATEKVQADATRKSADLQLRMLEDALALEQDRKAKDEKEAHPVPKYVNGFDSKGNPVEVNMNDFEVVD